MKLTADRPFADPAVAARKLLEIANATEAVQDGRIYIEKINDQFLLKEGGTPAEYNVCEVHTCWRRAVRLKPRARFSSVSREAGGSLALEAHLRLSWLGAALASLGQCHRDWIPGLAQSACSVKVPVCAVGFSVCSLLAAHNKPHEYHS
jgi:hypothetical protein